MVTIRECQTPPAQRARELRVQSIYQEGYWQEELPGNELAEAGLSMICSYCGSLGNLGDRDGVSGQKKEGSHCKNCVMALTLGENEV